MADYQAPHCKQMRFTLEHLAEFADVVALPAISAVDRRHGRRGARGGRDSRPACSAPDQLARRPQGVKVVDRARQVPAEFTDAYAKFRDGGWPGIASNPDFGGQGLPKTVAVACDEMWARANVAFALCPELSPGSACSRSTGTGPTSSSRRTSRSWCPANGLARCA